MFHTSAVAYSQDDITIVNRIKAEIIDTPGSNFGEFRLPCPAFTQVCSVYPDRPSVCASHKCLLLKRVMSGEIKPESASERVSDIKHILESLLSQLNQLVGCSKVATPEALMNKILTGFDSEEQRAQFKKNNGDLLAIFGAFRLLKESTFYPNVGRLESGGD